MILDSELKTVGAPIIFCFFRPIIRKDYILLISNYYTTTNYYLTNYKRSEGL